MIVLCTSLYHFSTIERRNEIASCIQQNYENRFIDKIVLFWDNVSDEEKATYPFYTNKKTVNVDISSRQTYKMMFDYANSNFGGEYIIVANSDIVFDPMIQYFYGRNWNNMLWCVARHNYHDGGWHLQDEGKYSADAWIFRAPLKDFENDIEMGIVGCDTYLASKAADAGINLLNPCQWLTIKHHHECTERNDNRYGKNYWQAPDYRHFRVEPSGFPG